MRLFFVLVLTCVTIARAKAQTSFRVVVDYVDSVVVLHEPKDVLRFHIEPDQNRPFTCGLLNGSPSMEVAQGSNASFTFRALADSLIRCDLDIGVGVKYDADNWPGAWQMLSVRLICQVLPDSGLRLEPFVVPFTLRPNYQVKRWVGSVPLLIVNRTSHDARLTRVSINGKALADSEVVFTRYGLPLTSHLIPSNENDTLELTVQSAGGAPFTSKRDTAHIEAHAVFAGVDTVLSSPVYLLWQQPIVKPEVVIGTRIHTRKSAPGVSVLDTFSISKSPYATLTSVIGEADWLKIDRIAESDSITEIVFRLWDSYRSLRRATPSLIYHSQSFVGDPHEDTIGIELNFGTTEIDHSIAWTSVELPPEASPDRASIAVDGSIVLPVGEDALALLTAGGPWIATAGPGGAVLEVQRLQDGSLFALTTDSVLHRSSDDGVTWNSVMDSLAQFRHAAGFKETWGSEVRVDHTYEVAGRSILLLAHNWYQTWAYGGEAYWYLLGSEDGVNWHRIEDDVAPPPSGWYVDSSSILGGLAQLRPTVRNDSANTYTCATAQTCLPFTAVGTLGGGVLEFESDSDICTNFMQGSIRQVACARSGKFFASNGSSLWYYDMLGDVWEIPPPWKASALKRLLFDFSGHLVAITDSALYRSISQYLEVETQTATIAPFKNRLRIDRLDPQSLELSVSGVTPIGRIVIMDETGRVVDSRRLREGGARTIVLSFSLLGLPHGNYFAAMLLEAGSDVIGFSH